MSKISSETMGALAACVCKLTLDRKNNTTGPGHYLTAATNAFLAAACPEKNIPVFRVTYPDFVQL